MRLHRQDDHQPDRVAQGAHQQRIAHGTVSHLERLLDCNKILGAPGPACGHDAKRLAAFLTQKTAHQKMGNHKASNDGRGGHQTQQYCFKAKFFQFRNTEFERHQKKHHRNHQIPGGFSGCSN